MKNKDGFEPCPFCGGTDIYWTHCLEAAYCVCADCEAQGPVYETEGEFGHKAEDLWNDRHSPRL